jgi:mono/diheme cytochrome c family protein
MATASPAQAMEDGPGASALLWFQRIVWIGIIANVVLTLTSIIFTEQVIALLALDPATPLVWPKFGAFGILLLTGFYIPAGIDPCRSPFATAFTVVCRFAGFFFFAIVGGRYIAFGLFDLIFGAPQAVFLYLAWRRTKDAAQGRPPGGRGGAAILALVFAAMFIWGIAQFLMAPIIPKQASDEDHFKYGSIGNDGAAGIPYPLWVVLPDVCARHLPRGAKGYAAFGFLWERGRDPMLDQPVGFSRARVGVERMSINCAICHTVRARTAADAEPKLYFGGAANTIDIQAYQRFLTSCANDEDFTADNLIPAMTAKFKLSWAQRLLYRLILIPVVRKQLKKQGEAYAWTGERPIWGPGRVDPFNPVKFGMLKLGDDGTIGNSDMLAVWNLGAREKIRTPTPYHWDGLSMSLHEVAISSALGDGAVAKEFNFASIARIERYLRGLPPPPSPHRPDAAAAERGKALFATHCGICHGDNGARTLTVIPPAEIGTDIQRNIMWTEAARATYTDYREGYDWDFKSFRKVDGYLAEPLYGLWLNGPYLHNGSVPTLRDLLNAPEERPHAFVRGLDVVDGTSGGFMSPPCDPVTPLGEGFCYDTRLIGNSNAGHLYGTALSAAEKGDLLAYLLTL